MQCQTCELFFVHPYPESANGHHEIVSSYAYENLEILDARRHYDGEVAFYRDYFPLIDRECDGAASFLDVGCGTGHLLERLSRPGLYRAGIELNRERAILAREIAKCDIFEVPLEKLAAGRSFDVITMVNVFSHIPAPRDFLPKVRSLLSPQGKLIIKTGEVSNRVKKRVVHDWGIPDHLQFLGLGTLEYLCKTYGFRIESRRRVPLSHEMFAPSAWRTDGRSALRNVIKAIVVRTPLALPLLARCYEAVHHKSVWSSFIVLMQDSD